MPKMKTVKSAAKRIHRMTRSGKLMRLAMSAQHRRKGKSKRAKREAGHLIAVTAADLRRIKRLVPYAKKQN